jgi:hypothetical protein
MECDFELREECNPIDPLVLTAYHEAGHTVVAALQRTLDGRQLVPLDVTIRPKNDCSEYSSEYGNLAGLTRLKPRNYYSEVDVIACLAGPYERIGFRR